MTTYKFIPSSIASVMTVMVDGEAHSCIYMSKERGVVVGNRETPLKDSGWPIEAQAQVNRYFGIAFSLPHENCVRPSESPRSKFVESSVPWSIEA